MPNPVSATRWESAVVDDIGAIVVIAVFYGDNINPWLLLVGAVIIGAVVTMRWLGIRKPRRLHRRWPHTVADLPRGRHPRHHRRGDHGPPVPVTDLLPQDYFDAEESGQELLDLSSTEAAGRTVTLARGSVSVIDWLEHRMHAWTSFVILPLFAVANAGVKLSADSFGDALTSKVTIGTVAGLVIGKTAGITGAVWLAVRLRIGLLPAGTNLGQILGLACVGGVGFTVSIFVSSLAFDDPTLRDQAIVGVLIAGLVAALVGSLLLICQATKGTTDAT